MAEELRFRSLADQLRNWSDEQLSALLAHRPDLATTTPHDFGQLASRSAARASLARALDGLTTFELSVLDALVVAGQTTPAELTTLIDAEPSAVAEALARVEALALAWRSTDGLRAVGGLSDALGGGPGTSGLWPRTADAPSGDVLRTRLAELSEPARRMLEHLLESRSEATTSGSRVVVAVDDARTPAEELLARRLLVPRGGNGTLVVPGEVGLALRGGHTTDRAVDVEPSVATSPRTTALIDRTAAGAAFEAMRRVEMLLERWGTAPPAVLRNGGLGVRDLRAAAAWMQVDDAQAALLVEVAVAAGLVGQRADNEGDLAWVPSDAFDAWLDQPTSQRWARLATTWLTMPRSPARVGGRDEAGKVRNCLSAEIGEPQAPATRRATLEAIAELPAGETLAAGTGLASLVAHLTWRRPRRPRSWGRFTEEACREAAALGMLGLGGAPAYLRELLDHETASALDPLLPEPVDHVLIQADLTAVAPGPLESTLARSLHLVADIESQGGATVYRFTRDSVRRALDVGWTAVELHDFLGSVSRTPVPQPLTYLVDDTVRTFGSIRVGHAEAFLRADDENALTELLHHPQAAGLGLRRLAPTVLISSTSLDVLLPRLRELGAAPVVEGPDGAVQVTRPDVLRARTPRSGSGQRRSDAASSRSSAARETARIAAAVTSLRAGDRAAGAVGAAGPPSEVLSPSGALAALREAIDTGTTVVIGYLDNQGMTSDRVVDPRSVDGGSLVAFDHRADDVRGFAVHRIRTVRPLAPSG
ncbi:helicase-associated domain-containing protein [Nocardioides sp. R-C-SC26]|uniref:helicase-associated domain-containing protein n=1 Tax=Nocardioides sp. R-C-SC26 TaxID=2870414 RepID=UPI001E3E9745|nr:helicase-associated domain-containing protein [Nocardioides sp. R-C-SC26]